jgi:hypothetical protein
MCRGRRPDVGDAVQNSYFGKLIAFSYALAAWRCPPAPSYMRSVYVSPACLMCLLAPSNTCLTERSGEEAVEHKQCCVSKRLCANVLRILP